MNNQIRSFLSLHEEPLKSLPASLGDEWILWEKTAKSIPSLLSAGTLRQIIDNELPQLKFSTISGEPSTIIERVYTMLCFLSLAYIRGSPGDALIKKLPRKLAQVWVDAAKALDLPPISTYASTVVFNVSFTTTPTCLDDLFVNFTSTGLKDEEWFYLVSAGIDLESEHIISIAERIKTGSSIDSCLLELNEIIKKLTSVLNRMYEKCEPRAFYHEIRGFFAGWLNDTDLDVKGLLYELDSGDVYFNLAGGSAAQTATIQLIDVILAVSHDNLETKEAIVSDKMKLPYLKEMRSYMPKVHRSYLEDCDAYFSQPKVRNAIETSQNYSDCVKSLVEFRNSHIIMVTRYIVSLAAKSQQSALGTGGSNPVPFLKRFRNDTLHKLDQ